MDDGGIVVTVEQDCEKLLKFFRVVADQLAVHFLHQPVDCICFYLFLLYFLQDGFHVSGRDGDMHDVERVIMELRIIVALFFRTHVDNGPYAHVLQFPARAERNTVNLCGTI